MIHLPILTDLRIANYRMFPGTPRGSGIDWSFHQGLSLIAGINGLGKTTMVTMILRSLTGPYDLTSEGMPQSLGVVLPQKPVSLKPTIRKAFASRVADAAKDAEATLSVEIAGKAVVISRLLNDLFLKELSIDGKVVSLPSSKSARETRYQSTLSKLMGLSSFVDVLLLLHYMVMFLENRPGALWDPNAQRQLLRALCLDQTDAATVVELERRVQSADSQARNIHARVEATRYFLKSAREQEARSGGVFAEIEAQQKLLDADLEEEERLEEALAQIDTDRKAARLAHERAKLEREDGTGAVERLKYTTLSRHFPSMDDTTRLVLSRIMTDERCLVCDAAASGRRAEAEQQIEQGCCPVCGSKPPDQDGVVPVHEFDQAKLDHARARAERAKEEEEAKSQELRLLSADYERTLDRLSVVQRSIEERRGREVRLRRDLPKSTTSSDYERTLKALDGDFRRWRAKRATELRKLQEVLGDKQGTITAKSNQLIAAFARLTQALLVEDVRLAPVDAEPRYLQAPGRREDRIQVPAYAAEMKAVDHSGFVARGAPGQVSESQRELVDLAFRLAMVDVFCGSSTFIMETPEASLDGVAMERVGRALGEFCGAGDNRLVVTSNLTNVGIITSLLSQGARAGDSERCQRVLNLMEVAAPNRALMQDTERYRALLQKAVSGVER